MGFVVLSSYDVYVNGEWKEQPQINTCYTNCILPLRSILWVFALLLHEFLIDTSYLMSLQKCFIVGLSRSCY